MQQESNNMILFCKSRILEGRYSVRVSNMVLVTLAEYSAVNDFMNGDFHKNFSFTCKVPDCCISAGHQQKSLSY